MSTAMLSDLKHTMGEEGGAFPFLEKSLEVCLSTSIEVNEVIYQGTAAGTAA